MDILKYEPGNMYPGFCFRGLVDIVTGGSARKARKAAAREAEKQDRLQRERQKAQEAAQLRQQQTLNEQEDTELRDIAGKRRAIAARRRGNGGLSFTPSGGLKSKLGE